MKRVKSAKMENPAPKRLKMATDSNIVPSTSDNICASTKVLTLSTINGDCLRNIADYLSIDDLLHLCIANKDLVNVVKDFVRGRLFDFDDLADRCHNLDLFKLFGQQMTKIRIGERNIQYKQESVSKFDEILRLITMYCSKHTLKHLELQYYYGSCINKQLVDDSIPFFRCIEKFKMIETDHHNFSHTHLIEFFSYFKDHSKYNVSVNDFIELVVENAVNISLIEMKNLRITGRFFRLNHVNSLKNLSLIGCNVKEPNWLISFMLKKPKLMSFAFKNSSLQGMDNATSTSSNSVFKLAMNNIADLEVFHFYRNVGYINDRNKYSVDFDYIDPDFELLKKFKKLKTFSVDTMTVDNWKLLAQHNTIEKLSVGEALVQPDHVDLKFVEHFRSLQIIRLSIYESDKEFIKQLLSKLPNLSECHLFFSTIMEDVIKTAVESQMNLSTLIISYTSGRIRTAMYVSLLRLRLRQGEHGNPLVIRVSKPMLVSFLSRLGRKYTPTIIALKPLIASHDLW